MTNYLVYSGLNVTISDTSGGEYGIGQGFEIIDSMFGPEVTIDLYGLAVSSLLSNASEIVQSGGVDSGSTVIGDVIVSSGGMTIDVTLDDGMEWLYRGAEAIGNIVTGGAQVLVYSGGLSIGGTVSSAVVDVGSGGVDSGASIYGGGSAFVAAGGEIVDATVHSGGELLLSSGAIASAFTVDSGGTLILEGYTLSNYVVSAGETVINQGNTPDATVESGGTLSAYGGGANGLTIESGGTAVVTGSVFGVPISPATGVTDDGVLMVGGLVTGTSVNSGGVEIVTGTVSASTISSGGTEIVGTLGVAVATTVSSGGLDIVSGSLGYLLSSVVRSGGEVLVEDGGYANYDDISGTLVVSHGAFLGSGDTIESGGVDVVMGNAANVVLTSGAVQIVGSGGIAGGTIVESGAVESAVSGGQAYGEIISSGGIVIASGSGTLAGNMVVDGGYELVESGAILTENVTISAGTFELGSGGLVSGNGVVEANFAGGVMVLDTPANFTNAVVAGFGTGDQIDFGNIGFTAGTTSTKGKKGGKEVTFTEAASNMSGTLTVTDGVNTANITLLGQYMAANFTATSDGHGGTIITGVSSSTTLANASSAMLAAPHA